MSQPDIPAPEETKEVDKRRDFRVPLRILKVDTGNHGDVFFGYATNISISGMFIQTSNPKEIGSRSKLHFQLPPSKEKIQVEVEVIWTRNYTGKDSLTPGMGVRFVDVDSSLSALIREFVEKS